ncbi:hypothetical protein ACG83_21920 [Frankia sp. R43]|uniref:hypothetical protein n=1 Tax=Frankia sp. R43 TaxID=269536 RepID=UPI0006CA0679|nr:hypothetical protein [Frankia sp. R43]KPM53381.1 hypothetical protein ACG83_21920 [Frankia sp. R43]
MVTVPDVADLWVALDGAVRRGADAGALIAYAPDVVRLLVGDGGLPLVVRAVAAEGLLRAGAGRLPARQGAAVGILFGLTDTMRGQPLGVRRRRAAGVLHLSPWTLQKPRHRDALVVALAGETLRFLVDSGSDGGGS